jgi:hypothetical protein
MNLTAGTWSGTVTVLENISTGSIDEDFVTTYLNQGYEMLLRNTALMDAYLSVYNYAIENGMLFVVPVGSNNYHSQYTDFDNLYSVVLCGSGVRDYGNATAYNCMFYDCAPAELNDYTIKDIRQCGTSYNITHVARLSSSRLGIKLDGYNTEALLRSIGIFMYLNVNGTNHSELPMYFAGLTGTDITSLPSGIKYISYVGNGYFEIYHTTSAGTLTTYQAVTGGTVKFGSNDSTEVMLQISDYHVAYTGSGITILGTEGFQNDVNGAHAVTSRPDYQGFGDKMTITFNLGTGSNTGTGRMVFATQSYSTPYIAGQLAYMKDQLNYNWFDVIGNAITTASNSVIDTYSGYGYLNADAGSDSLIDINLEAPELVLTETSVGNVGLIWNIIPFADSYEIYFRGELLATTTAHITYYNHALSYRQDKCRKNFYEVRAVRNGTYSEFSNSEEYNYYYNTGILVKSYA